LFDKETISGEFIFGMVTNSLSVGGFKLRGTKHVILDDGKFDCLFVRKPEKIADVQRLLTQVLTNNIKDDNPLIYMTKSSKVVVKSDDEIKWTLDGEFGGAHKEVEIINHQKALKICLNGEYYLEEAIEEFEPEDDMDNDGIPDDSDESTFADYGDDFEDGWDK
ncbi:MAG: hypothetical protein IJT72_03960, partial [Lachnospiraceae bacterium]|nr:hypothetical protein [Lachnospiraceae bacterium]